MIEVNLFSMLIGVIIGELVRSYIGQKIRQHNYKRVKKITTKSNKTTEKDSKTES